MGKFLAFAFMFLAATLLSQTVARGQMPLPRIFFDAKTIAIVNDSGEAEIGDRAYDELKTWGRYTIVSEAKNADLVLVLTSRVDYVGSVQTTTAQTTANVSGSRGTANTTATQTSIPITHGKTYVIVFNGKTGDKVWSDGRNWGTFKSATHGLIKDLRQRVEKQEKKK
jgi:hypothetical protein